LKWLVTLTTVLRYRAACDIKSIDRFFSKFKIKSQYVIS